MNKYIGLLIFCIHLTLIPASAQNINDQWKILNKNAMALEKSGEYGLAILTNKQAILIARKTCQSTNKTHCSNELRTSLSHLASTYKAQGNYAETIPIYEEMLKIWEEAVPSNPDAVTMKNLADAYRTQGRHPEAELIYLKSLKSIINASKTQPPGSFYDGLVISIYRGLSASYWVTERESEAEAMDRQANRIKSKEN